MQESLFRDSIRRKAGVNGAAGTAPAGRGARRPRLPAGEPAGTGTGRAFAAVRGTGARHVVPYPRFPGGCHKDAAPRARR
ncbi:hypothetical protein GCM10010327_47370 [Streptomyces nitrosporeus]|nr:hypothetical protein GCM10010327_47370 [Streptomyces nitrosporeus]